MPSYEIKHLDLPGGRIDGRRAHPDVYFSLHPRSDQPFDRLTVTVVGQGQSVLEAKEAGELLDWLTANLHRE